MTFEGNTEEKRELVIRARPGNCRAKVLGWGSAWLGSSEGASVAAAGLGDLRSGQMGGASVGSMPRIWLDCRRGDLWVPLGRAVGLT